MELEFRDISRRYGAQYALKGLNATLHAGDCCLLLGPNGSGKSTLMKLISGLTRPTSGTIELDGAPLCTADRARIAYMPTENYFYDYMSIGDAGRYYADFFPDFDLNAYKDRIERAKLSLDMRIRTLSSGMSAKLRLALILSRDAQIMMFDEPINGVDMLTRDWVLQEIAARKDESRILLISTHLVEQAEHLANRALFLRSGLLVKAGAMQDICAERRLEDIYREIYGEQEAAPC